MTERLFNVVASGHAREGCDPVALLAALQQQLKLQPAQARQLLAGRRVTIKRRLPATAAERYANRLFALGLAVSVVPQADSAGPGAAPQPPVAEQPDSSPAATAVPLPDPDAWLPRQCATAPHLLHDLRWLTAAGAVLLIPLGWLTLMLILLALLIAHGIGNLLWLQAPPWWWSGVLYALPLLLGSVLTVLLARPLWPQRRERAVEDGATVPAPPELLALVQTCALRLGVTVPAQLLLGAATVCDCRQSPGARGLWRGAPVLHVGLARLRLPPTCWLPSLAAALAPATPLARRCRHLVEGAEAWLARRLDHHDRLGEWLQKLPGGAWIEARFQRGRDALVLRLLTLIAAIALPARCASLRRADAAAATLTGSGFRAWRHAELRLRQAGESVQAGRTRAVDNLPALIAEAATQLDPIADAAITRELRATPPLPGRRLPTESERIEAAAAVATVRPVLPQTALTMVAPATEEAITLAHYRACGISVEALQPLAEALDELALRHERHGIAEAYFNGWLQRGRGWQLPEAALIATMPVADAAAQLHVCVAEIRRLTPDRAQLLMQWERLGQQLAELQQGQQLLALQEPFSFRLNSWDGGPLAPLLTAKQEELAAVAAELALQESIMGGRLAMGLRLCGESEDERTALHRRLQRLGPLVERVGRLRQEAVLLAALLARRRNPRCQEAAVRQGHRVEEQISQILARLVAAPGHAGGRWGDRVNALPAATGAAAAVERADQLEQQLWQHFAQASAQAAEWAAGSEEAYRIERIRRLTA